MNRLTRFENHPQYETFKGTDHYTKANVSICTTEYHIHYDDINYKNEYLTITPLDDGYFICSLASEGTILYSLDNGKTWTEYTNGNNVLQELPKIPVTKDQKILVKGNLNDAVTSIPDGETVFINIVKDNTDDYNVDFNVSGNLLSIGYGDDFVGKEKLTNQTVVFTEMFSNTNVVSAKNLILPQPTSENMYAGMFDSCTKLIETPKLPHMSLTPGCYSGMFSGCTSLTAAPELPDTRRVSPPRRKAYSVHQGKHPISDDRDFGGILSATDSLYQSLRGSSFATSYMVCGNVSLAAPACAFRRTRRFPRAHPSRRQSAWHRTLPTAYVAVPALQRS